MRALLKKGFLLNKKFAGKWVDIDVKNLFNNQYNTTEEYGNMRIFDADIQKIENDARINKGRCKYCGAIVERGHEEEHFVQMEEKKKSCSMNHIETKSCFWKSKKYLDEKTVKEEIKTEMTDGVAKTVYTKTVEQEWTPYCSYEKEYGECTHDEHRKMGISWFTEENCFFLKYPNGFEQFTLVDWAKGSWCPRWKDSEYLFVNVSYSKMLGSYTLQMELSADKEHVNMFTLENARKTIRFTYDKEDKNFIIFDGIHGNSRVAKELLNTGNGYPKCNATINKAVRIAIEDIVKH